MPVVMYQAFLITRVEQLPRDLQSQWRKMHELYTELAAIVMSGC